MIGKVAPLAPTGTVTLGGTVATVVSALASATTTPPAGAAPATVTVPWEGSPPVTVFGLTLRVARVPGVARVSLVARVVLRAARMNTFVTAETGCVVTVKVALFAPGGIVTVAGTDARAGLVLPRVTSAPLDPVVRV